MRSARTKNPNRSHRTLIVNHFVAIILVATIATATAQTKDSAKTILVQAAGFAESVPVRDLPKAPISGQKSSEKEINPENREIIRHIDPRIKPSADKALSSDAKAFGRATTPQALPALPAPAVSFEGISQADTVALGQGFLPPDTNGAAGPNHYVQTVNVTFRVWDKAGTPLTNTATLSSLFAP